MVKINNFDTEVFTAMSELLPTLQEYQDLKPKFIKIKVEKYNDGALIKIKSDDQKVSDALCKIFLSMAKFSNQECKIESELEDKSNV